MPVPLFVLNAPPRRSPKRLSRQVPLPPVLSWIPWCRTRVGKAMLVQWLARWVFRIPGQPVARWPLRFAADFGFGKPFTGGCRMWRAQRREYARHHRAHVRKPAKMFRRWRM